MPRAITELSDLELLKLANSAAQESGSVGDLLQQGRKSQSWEQKPIDTRTFQQYDKSNPKAKEQLEQVPAVQLLQGIGGNERQGDKFVKVIAENVGNPMAAMAMPINPKLPKQAVKVFGRTLNPEEAGYILHDGKMLDFSGRYYGDPGRNPGRNVDHRELAGSSKYLGWGEFDLAPESSGGTDSMFDFMNQSGAVRWMPESNGISITAPLTKEQASQIIKNYNSVKRSRGIETLLIDADHPEKFYTIESAEFDRPNIDKLMDWSKKVFPKDLRPGSSSLDKLTNGLTTINNY